MPANNRYLPLRKAISGITKGSFLLILIASGVAAFAQQSIGTRGFEAGSAIKLLPDGGFIIGGYTESYGLAEADMMLIRTDASGNVVWSQTYGGPEREVINDVVQTTDLGFMAIGEKYQPDKKQGEFLTLIKTDASGNLLWKKMFDEGGNETEGFSMTAAPDGNYLVAGIVRSLNITSGAFYSMRPQDQSLFLLKVDGNGNKVWSKRLSTPGSLTSTGVSVIAARDGSYVIAGNVTKKGEGTIEKSADSVSPDEVRNLLLVKVKPDGALAWAKEYEAKRIAAGMSVIEKMEGGFAVTGICTPDNTNNIDYFVMSLSDDGTVQWSRTFGGSKFDSANDIKQVPDGGLIVSGHTTSFSDVGDLLVIKTDKNGALQWSKLYGGENGEFGGSMTLTSAGIVMTGEGSVGAESFDVLFLKMDWNGKSGCWGKDIALAESDFRLVARDIQKPAMAGVKPVSALPPDFRKADVNNIAGQKRETRVMDICK